MSQPNNVDFRLKRVFEMARYLNAKSTEERVEYATKAIAPMVRHLQCPVMRKAFGKIVSKYAVGSRG